MSEVSLFPHNEIGYEKLENSVEQNDCTTINHATGTGKSFIALKFLHKHRAEKWLYIAPTYPIIDQLLESCYKIGLTPNDINIGTMIYRNLLGKDMEQLYEEYDVFLFDEYHREGATKTYRKIKQLKLLLYEEIDKWFEDFGPIKKYKVHSRVGIEPEEKGKIKSIKEKNKMKPN